MITLATGADLPQIETLWKVVFGDSQPFIHYLIRELISPHNTWIDKHYNTVRGMSITFSADLYCSQKTYHVYYIYGVGVLPQYRNQQIATKLLQHIATHAQDNDMDGLVLMPASESLFSYYAKQNFQTCFSLQKITFKREHYLPLHRTSLLSISSATITELRNQFLQQFSDHAVLWSENQIQQRYELAKLFDEEWFILPINDKLIYIMAEKKSNTNLLIKECNCLENDFISVNNFLFHHFPTIQEIEYLLHPALSVQGTTFPIGMILPLSTLPFHHQAGYMNLCLD